MAEGVNVRFSGVLQQFVKAQAGKNGMYQSASEYIRALVRNDYEKAKNALADDLYKELEAGMKAPASDFTPFNVEEILAEAKSRRHAP